MKRHLFKNMLATIAALFIAIIALPTTAQAQENTVTIDGVEKTILSTEFIAGYGDDDAFSVYLYLSSDKKEYVNVHGNKDLHAIYDDIYLNQYEEKHANEDQWYWRVIYTKNGYGNELFDAYANPDNDHAVFTNGFMLIYGDPRTSRKICGIRLYHGKITDTKHGDGQEHTITIQYKYERTEPSAGTLTVGTVTDTSIDLSWTHGSDDTTPQDKLYYIMQYRKVGNIGWRMPGVGNATSYTIEGLEPETEYEVSIGVHDESGNYTRYGVQTVTTKKAAATDYGFTIAGVQVTSANCNDLSVIPGVSGTVKYDPETNTLTLNNATIHATGEKVSGIYNEMDGLTINLIGSNTITSDNYVGISNREISTLTFTGGGSLKVFGSTTAEKPYNRHGIYNIGNIIVKDCTLEASGGIAGIRNGYWTFDNCTKCGSAAGGPAGGSEYGEYMGSLCWMREKPVFIKCAVTAPEGAYWKEFEKNGNTYYSLFGADDKVVTDWVTIEPTGTPQAPNTVIIDGVEKPVLKHYYADRGDGNFNLWLYLSANEVEEVCISSNPAFYKDRNIDLTKKETTTHDYWEWAVSYQDANGKQLFSADGGFKMKDHVVFTTGTMRIDGDPAGAFDIRLWNGSITDPNNGDGKPHTISIKYSNDPTGIDTPTASKASTTCRACASAHRSTVCLKASTSLMERR